MSNAFRQFFYEVEPVRIKEPLAATLGALKNEETVIEYTFSDLVKTAGHACPTISGAFLCCKKALDALYHRETPVRGDIAVTVYGEPDEGVYGVMGQAFGFITGAAPKSGFRGLGHKFKRKDLLTYVAGEHAQKSMRFEFRRLDNNRAVIVEFNPSAIPFPEEKSRRSVELLEKVIWEAAKEEEKREFQDLWMMKIHLMLLEQRGIENWIKITERRDKNE